MASGRRALSSTAQRQQQSSIGAAVKVGGGGATGAMLCLVGFFLLVSIAFALRFRSGAWRRIELIEPKLV